jgi:hypothetical protein
LLLTPVAVSCVVGCVALALGGADAAALEAQWIVLLLLGPSIPIYLLWLPLFPFALRALRRGWVPGRLRLVGGVFAVAIVFDAVFWFARP